MIVLQLMIAHLLGDFVFQTNKILDEKYKSWVGTFKHATIIFLFTLLMLIPYLGSAKAWLVAGTIYVLHFAQDVFKVWYDKNHNKHKSSLPFFLDQAGHIGLILLIGRGFENVPTIDMPEWFSELYFSETFSTLFVTMILISYVVDIIMYQFKRKKHKKTKYHPNYIGMLQRIWAFTIFYVVVFVCYQLFFST